MPEQKQKKMKLMSIWHVVCNHYEVVIMKFDSSALPLLPTPQQLTELNDLLVTTTELYQIYTTLERHPRVIGSPKSVELFTSCTEQLHQDM